jgi:hypothetical protein
MERTQAEHVTVEGEQVVPLVSSLCSWVTQGDLFRSTGQKGESSCALVGTGVQLSHILGNTQARCLSDQTASLPPVLGIAHGKKTSRRDGCSSGCTACIFCCGHVCTDEYNTCNDVTESIKFC